MESVSHAPEQISNELRFLTISKAKINYVEIKAEMAAILDSIMAAILDSNISNTQDL